MIVIMTNVSQVHKWELGCLCCTNSGTCLLSQERKYVIQESRRKSFKMLSRSHRHRANDQHPWRLSLLFVLNVST